MTYPTWVAEDVVPPRLSHRQAALRVSVLLAAAGVVVGALWAWLVPPVQIVVALTRGGDRVRGYVGDESDHVFLGALLMTGFLFVVAVPAAVAVWQWRAHRGPVMVGALTVGLLAAAGLAAGVGTALSRWRYGVVDLAAAPVSPEHRVHYAYEAPAVFFGDTPWQIAASIVLPAGVAALLYAIGTLSVTRDDLGAWPPVGRPVYVVATDPAPTAAGDPAVDRSSPLH
ncbi:MAG: DUF2567 domain-containing protein [Mycobacterium sp.]